MGQNFENEQLVWGKAPPVPLIYKQGRSTSLSGKGDSRFISRRRQQSHKNPLFFSGAFETPEKSGVLSLFYIRRRPFPGIALCALAADVIYLYFPFSVAAFSWARGGRERSLRVCIMRDAYLNIQSSLCCPCRQPRSHTHTARTVKRVSINFMARKENDWMSNSGQSHQSWLINQARRAQARRRDFHAIRRDRAGVRRKKGWRENYVHISTQGGVKIALFSTCIVGILRITFTFGHYIYDKLFLIDFVAHEGRRDSIKLLTGGTNSPAEKFLPILQGSLQPHSLGPGQIVIYRSAIKITSNR